MHSGPRFRTLTRHAPNVAALALLTLLVHAPRASAQQVTKPTTTTTTATYTRLPAPGPVVAKQQPDGSILVTWRAIAGATSYQVTRSVPPAAAQVVANPTDSSYVDTNVQTGSQYYYMVAAVSSGGTLGLKSGSQPVTATATAAPSLVSTGTTGTAGGGTAGGSTAPTTTLVAPVKVDALAQGSYLSNVVFFGFRQSGLTYRVERGLYSAKSATPSSWQLLQTTGPLPCCTWSIIDPLSGVTGAVMYRVTAVDPANPGVVSPPTTSSWINPTPQPQFPTATGFYLPDDREVSRTDKVGTTLPLPPTGMILDPNGVLSLDARGFPVAAKPGVGHYLWGSLAASGMPIVQVVRVTVIP